MPETANKLMPMQQKFIQIIGLALSAIYATAIIWIYATEPRSFREVATGAQVAAGTYQVDQEKFNAALTLFRRDQFRAARDEWQRADSAQSDPRTQFYIAYSFYREGWGRVYYDQDLFKQGLDAVNRAIALSPAPLTVDDENLQMHTAAELKAELEQGTERSWGDVNPLKVLRTRK
jgi:tetratricopeptide (TPR) repeat protein